MENNGVPDKTEFIRVGNSIHLKIPPTHYDHLGVRDLQQEDTPNRKDAKIMKEKNPEGEHYGSFWNPNHETQKNSDQE